jgi:hypothetical protein
MNNTSSHRIQHRLAVVDTEVPNFMGVRNGVYLSSNDGKSGNVIFFEDGVLKYKTQSGVVTILSDKIIDHISIGCKPLVSLPGSVLIGESNGESLVAGCDNVFVGRNVATVMMEGNDIVAIGSNTIKDSSAIGGSVAIGAGAMGNCGKTEMNIAIGKDALVNINDAYNIAIGVEAGKDMEGPLMNHNISVGRESMASAKCSAISLVAIGSESCASISGNNFQSVYIGDKVARRLSSGVISVNNVGIGSEALSDAKDISDVVCIGSMAGQNISGVRSVVIGTKAGSETEGCLNNDILIGTSAGSSRKYTDSHVILLGANAGSNSSGVEAVAIGNNSGESLSGDYNVVIGSKAGEHLSGNENVHIGLNSGVSSKGDKNICIGPRSGYGLEGSRNVWIGEGPVVADVLENSVVIGPQIFVKGSEAVVIGSQVGKSSVGYLNRDILIGANAGMGQKYNESSSENRGMLLIGANAGLGNPDNPETVNSADLVCLGHSAGHSNEQTFQKTVFIGNYAGSFAENVHESVIVGHSAGVGMCGESNIFLGPHAGFNVKGSRNILIGSHCGDQAGEIEAQLDNVLAVGHSNRPTILGNLENGNILLGSVGISTKNWADATGTLGFSSTERPASVSSSIGGVLYANGKHLEFATDKRTTNLTFPYKFTTSVVNDTVSYTLDLSRDGGTLLSIRAVPSSLEKLGLLLKEDVMLTVVGKTCSVTRLSGFNNEWKFSVVEDKLVAKCSEIFTGIFHIEAVGIHMLK